MNKFRLIWLLWLLSLSLGLVSTVFSQSNVLISAAGTSETATSDTPIGSSADPLPVAIGETITFRLQFVLYESTTISLRIDDVFSSGLAYVSGSARVSYLADTVPSMNGDFTGIQNESTPTLAFPAARLSNSPATTLDFDFGSVINNDGDGDIEFLIIEYDAVVLDELTTASGTSFTNGYQHIIDEGLPTEVIMSSPQFYLVAVEPELTLTKAFSPASQVRGGTTTLTLTAQNLSTDGATGPIHDLVIIDTLDDWLNVTGVTVSLNPAATTFGSSFVNNSVLTPGFASGVTDQINVSVSGLPVDGTATVTITLEIDPNADSLLLSRTITNTASVSADSLDSDATPDDEDRAYSDSDSDDLSIVKPTLLVTNTESTDPIDVRDSISYTITVQNSGTPSIDATNIVLTDELPTGFTLTSALPSQGTCAALVGSTLTCSLGTIASGASASVVITGGYSSATANGVIVNNIAYVTSTEGNHGNDGNDTPADNDDERAEEPSTVQNDNSFVAGITLTETDGSTQVIEGGAVDTFSIVLTSQPLSDVVISLTADAQVTTDSAALTFTLSDWNTPQIVSVSAVDDVIAQGTHGGSVSFTVASADPDFDQFALASVAVVIIDNESPGLLISPLRLNMDETTAPQTYQIAPYSVPSAPFTVQLSFDGAQLSVNGSSAPLTLTFTTNTPQVVTVDVLDNPDDNLSRVSVIRHTITSSGALEYPTTLVLPSVEVSIFDVPPPPPTPLCEAHNFDDGGVVRSSVADADGHALNCRVLYQNGASTSWLGGALYSEANLGVAGLLDLGVQQAVDIFSPGGLSYFNGGAVFCLRGTGTLIWLAASSAPRHPEIIGSYTVPEFPNFTCATLFEPGTLVLVRDVPRQ